MSFARTARGLLLVTAATTLIPAGAFAQDTAASDEASADGDIIVTARKREESLQDVPISVQAFGADALASAGIKDLSEVAYRVPGLKLSAERAVDTELFIRGIGSDTQGAAADSAVGIFVDGVYLSRGSGSLVDLYDLERVEVLKGPQSLRFGKSVVGGLFNYVTKRPGDTFEGRFEATYGTYDKIDVAGAVRGPLSDTISFGITASSKAHDGYAVNTRGGDSESQDTQSVRGQLRFRPNDTLDINLSADYTRHRDGARWVDVLIAADSTAVTYNSFFAPPIASLPGFVLPDRNLPFKNANPRKGPRNFNGFQNADMHGVSASIDWEASDSLSVFSQTAYRDVKMDVREDASGLFFNFPFDPATGTPIINSAVDAGLATYLNTVPDSYFDNSKTDNVKQFSQELRLRWSDGGPFQVEVGGYFLSEDISRSETVNFLFADFDTITEFAFALEFGGTPASPSGGVSFSETYSKNTNIGLFGELTYRLSDLVSIDAGLRYAYDRKKFTAVRFGDSFGAPIVGGGYTARDTRSWDAILPSATIRFEPSDNATLYLRYAKGYKPGGWTGENAGDPTAALVSFKPELADSFEAGAKLALADRRIRINAAAYLTNYKDLQTNQFVQVIPTRPPDNFVVNAVNGTRAYGLELEVTGKVSNALTLSANYAFTHCEFTGTLIVDDNGTDIDGNTCRRTPKHAFALGADLQQPINDRLVFVLGADFQYTGSNFFDNENKAVLKFESETLLNARVGIRATDSKWELSGWIKNLTNELNYTSKFELFDTIYGTYIPPRTYGATFKVRF